MSEDIVYKVLLLGDSSVGKTCFLLRYCDKSFQDAHLSTIGLDYRLKTLTLKNKKMLNYKFGILLGKIDSELLLKIIIKERME